LKNGEMLYVRKGSYFRIDFFGLDTTTCSRCVCEKLDLAAFFKPDEPGDGLYEKGTVRRTKSKQQQKS
jgi:hypothetical protein